VAGILIERVAGAPLDEVLSKRIFEPLGMTYTAFSVPAAKMGRFTSMYAPEGAGLRLVDGPDGWYAAPPALPDAAGWLVSTIDDLGAFAWMLAADGGGLLSPSAVRLMLRDRTTERDRSENPWFFGEHGGWRLMMSVRCELVCMSAHLRSPALPRDGPGLTRWRGAGLTFHGHLHPGGCLTVGSASVCDLRATPGDLPPAPGGQVDRRVHVPVQDQAAGGACVSALGQGQLGSHRAAARAFLA
jgi:CubicO group peptidase (beta-lactamase class C family)